MGRIADFPHGIDAGNRGLGRAPPVHTKLYHCARCGETLSSPAQFYECPAAHPTRHYIPTHLLPRLPTK